MNLFLPSPSINTSVQSLDDKRVNKMILETAQLLSTAIHIIDPNHDLTIYKMTHKNHPVSVWVRSSKDNFIFVINYFKAISDEYTFRTAKVHKSFSLYPVFIEFITSNYEFLELPTGVTPFANCTEFKEDEVHTAYKKTLVAKWVKDKLTPKWSNRNKPKWA
jgi:hypothetical protein